jgi:hypothetical protein
MGKLWACRRGVDARRKEQPEQTSLDRYYRQLSVIKSSVWQSENEWRLMWRSKTEPGDVYKIPITPDCVRAIYLGLAIAREDREKAVGSVARHFPNAEIWHAAMNDSRYAAEGNRPEAVRWLLAAAEQGLPRAQIKHAEIYAGEPDMPESSVRACGWILLATASLRGAHLQSAQSAYPRACIGLMPAEIEQARSFAQSWRPVGRPVPQCWVREKVPKKTHMINC